jgi:hemoglobin
MNTVLDTVTVNKIVDVFYSTMLDDYRINRFFFTRPISDQTDALKAYLAVAVCGGKGDLYELLDNYFTVAFARTNAKPSMVTGNDFAFLLDVVGGQEIRTITPLCPAHNHLIKLGPDDDNFDVVMEHVSNALKQLNMPTDISQQVLAIAESAREDVLARGTELLREAA